MLTGNDWSMTVKVDGYQPKEDENMNPSVDGIAPRFFSTIGVPLVSGREFTEKDVAGAPKVAILNETMAKYYFGDATRSAAASASAAATPPTSRSSASSATSATSSCATRRFGSSTSPTRRTTP